MSGGVDSSVAAALLKEQNYDVIGVYILGWTGTEEFPCNWQSEEADARTVASKLEIPFYTVNLSKEYEQAVIDEFFAGYAAGVTPNPDILCNREIKFKALWQAVRQFEPNYLATGHYAQLREIRSTKSEIRNSFEIRNSKFGFTNQAIFKAHDENKDQTYFLWGISREILSHILFPLGDLTKPQVRQLANKSGLPTATKKDSQGICFIGPLKVRQFLASRLKSKPGVAVLTDGRVIAHHDGVNLYTIGQRLGAGSVSWTGDVPPLFVIAKDLKNNRLIVGPDSQTYASELVASQANWLTEEPFDSLALAQGGFHRQIAMKAKIRYRQEDVDCTVSLKGEELLVRFGEPVRAITPGQSIVFYSEKGQLLGGAVIASVPAADQIIQKLDGRTDAPAQKKSLTKNG